MVIGITLFVISVLVVSIYVLFEISGNAISMDWNSFDEKNVTNISAFISNQLK